MDDLNKKGAGDRSKINMHEDYEVNGSRQTAPTATQIMQPIDLLSFVCIEVAPK